MLAIGVPSSTDCTVAEQIKDLHKNRQMGGFDIALLRLVEPVLELVAQPARLYTGRTENRRIGT